MRPSLGPQWEWNHNPDDAHWSLAARPGYLRLIPMPADGLLSARNTLTQSMQDNSFEFTVRVDLTAMKPGVHAGLAMFEQSASGLEIVQSGQRAAARFLPSVGARRWARAHANSDPAPRARQRRSGPSISTRSTTARASIRSARPRPSASVGGKVRGPLSLPGPRSTPIPGAVDFDWAHYQPLAPNPW